MSETICRILLLTALMTASACSNLPLLVETPMQLSESPTVARLSNPVHTTGGAVTLCFEFHPPGDSHAAGGISATLLDASGGRYRLVNPALDRRGESLVCQVGSLEALGAGGGTAPPDRVVLEAIELSATTPVRVRAIRGGSRQAGG